MNKKKLTLIANYLLFAALSATLVVKCANNTDTATHTTHWDYTDPTTWPTDYPTCGGTEQSPIDIVTASATAGGNSAATLNVYNNGAGETWEYVNNGHSVQANYTTTNGTYAITLPNNSNRCTGCGATITYTLVQYHFHSGSEHTVNGQQYDAELHLVHKYTDASNNAHYAVLGILIDDATTPKANAVTTGLTTLNGGAADTTLDAMVNQIVTDLTNVAVDTATTPSTMANADPSTLLANLLNVSNFLPHFNYQGSLTTPPCTEAVDEWIVISTPVALSSANLTALQGLMPTNNFRPVQNLGTRTVTSHP